MYTNLFLNGISLRIKFKFKSLRCLKLNLNCFLIRIEAVIVVNLVLSTLQCSYKRERIIWVIFIKFRYALCMTTFKLIAVCDQKLRENSFNWTSCKTIIYFHPKILRRHDVNHKLLMLNYSYNKARHCATLTTHQSLWPRSNSEAYYHFVRVHNQNSRLTALDWHELTSDSSDTVAMRAQFTRTIAH